MFLEEGWGEAWDKAHPHPASVDVDADPELLRFFRASSDLFVADARPRMACPYANETVPEGKVARLMTVEDEINEQIQITGSKGVAQLCALIEARVAEFNAVNVAKAFRWVLQGQTANETRRVVDCALRVLEESAVQNFARFKTKEFVNLLYAVAKARYSSLD